MSIGAPAIREDSLVGKVGAVPTGPSFGEILVIDPIDIVGNENRVELDITAYVGSGGPDYGTAEITQYLADAGMMGQTSIDFKIPNRTITIPIVVQDRGLGRTFEQVRAALQAKVGLLQYKGGILKRTTSVGNVYAEIVGASLKLGGSTFQATQDVDPDAILTLTTLPDWFGDLITLTGVQVVGGFESFTATNILGDLPARTRIRVTDTSNHQKNGLIWGMRSHNYSSDATAQVYYPATLLSPQGTASISGSNIEVISLPRTTDPYNPQWDSGHVLSTTLRANNANLTHTGSYRVWARVSARGSGSTTTVSLRWTWDIGNLIVGTSNAPTPYIPTYGANYLMDLGQVRFDQAPIGTHYWQGRLDAMSLGTTEGLDVSAIFFMPVDDGYGTLNAVSSADAVIYPNQSVEIRTDGVYGLSTGGYGPVSRVIGDLPRLPVSGLELRTVEVAVLPTASDFNALPDSSPNDAFNLQIIYSPCSLFVAE